MSAEIEYLNKLAKYLQVPLGKVVLNNEKIVAQTLNNETILGFASIASALLKGTHPDVSAKNLEENTEFWQWLEHASLYLKQYSNPTVFKNILMHLNSILESRMYFVGNRLTVVDVIYYHIVYNSLLNATLQEKVQLKNLCRWFDCIQEISEIRQNNALINFNANYILCQ